MPRRVLGFLEDDSLTDNYLPEDFFAEDFLLEDFFFGTLPPARRACDRPIAIACFLLVTFFPDF